MPTWLLKLGNTRDAEEVLQETCVIMLQEQAKFQPGTDFVAWASTIAYNQVRKIRRQRGAGALILDPALLDQIAKEHVAQGSLYEARCEALNGCLDYVVNHDRLLLREVYGSRSTIKLAAEQIGRPVNTVYKALNRIRRQLLE